MNRIVFNTLIAKIQKDVHFFELIKGSFMSFSFRILGIVSSYIFVFIVTKIFGAKGWGIFVISISILNILTFIGKFGIDLFFLRFVGESLAKKEVRSLKEGYKKSITIIIILSSGIAVLFYFLSPVVATKVFHKSYLSFYFKIISFVIVPSVLLSFHAQCIRGLKRIIEYMLFQQAGKFVISIILILVGLLFTRKQILPVAVYCLSVLVLSIISFYLWNKYLYNLDNKYSCQASSNLFLSYFFSYKKIISISLSMFMGTSIFLIMSYVDTIMLGIWKTEKDIGVYNVGVKLSSITGFVLTSISSIAAPKFAEFWGKKDFKKLKKLSQQSTKISFWATVPIFILYLMFPDFFMGLFGEEFKKGSLVLILLSLGQFVNAASGCVGDIFMMTNKHAIYRNIIFFAFILNVIMNYILIPKYGITGAAIASVVSMLFWDVVFLFYIKKVYGFLNFYPLYIFLEKVDLKNGKMSNM